MSHVRPDAGRGTRRRPRYSAARLVRRQLAAEPGPAALVAVVVLLVSLVLSLWPRAVDALLGDDLAEQVDALAPARRDLSGRAPGWFPTRSEAGALGSVTGGVVTDELDGHTQLAAWLDELESARAEAGPQLASVLAETEVVATRPRDPVDKGPRAADVVAENLAVRLDARIGDRVVLVEGRAPGAYDIRGLLEGPVLDFVRERPVEVMASVDTADRMRWGVGETREMLGVMPFRMTLVGTFEAVDPGAGYWSHQESTLFPLVIEDGNVGTTVNGTAYADPSALGALVMGDGLDVDYWHTTEPAQVATADRDELLRELRAFLAEQRMSSELPDELAAVGARQGTFTALLDVLAVGPVGVALGVLWLATVLATERRRGALGLAAARGGSRTAIRSAMAAQGLVVGLPAAALGALGAALLLPRPAATVGAAGWLLPVAVGLAPAVLMAVAAGPAMRGTRRERADARPSARTQALGGAGGGSGAGGAGGWRLAPPTAAGRRRFRLGLEAAVLGLAAFAAWAVRQRGPDAGASEGGADPLLVATPVLLALAGGLLALRFAPLPLRALTRALHARRRLPHFLGAAEATRSARAGLAAVVALVLGVGITVFSGVTLTTVRGGVERTAAAAVGADLRVDGAGIPDDAATRVGAIDGVAHVAAVATAGRVPMRLGNSDSRVDVLTVDPDDVAAVQAALPGVDPLPELRGAPDGTVRAVLGGADSDDLDRDVVLRWGADFARLDLEPVAGADALPGVTSGRSWVVVDREAWVARTGEAPATDRLLVDLEPGADAGAVADAVRVALGADDAALRLTTTTPGQVRAGVEDAALVRGLTVGLAAAAGLAGLLSVLVLVLALAVRAPERGRLVALLATVGAPRGTTWRTVAWEVWPLAAVSVAAGAAVGAALPLVVLATADLRPFTGGLAQPPIAADPAAAGAAGAVVVVTVLLAVALAAAGARSTRPADVLREGERP